MHIGKVLGWAAGETGHLPVGCSTGRTADPGSPGIVARLVHVSIGASWDPIIIAASDLSNSDRRCARLYFFLDGEALAEEGEEFVMRVGPGRHVLACSDAKGARRR